MAPSSVGSVVRRFCSVSGPPKFKDPRLHAIFLSERIVDHYEAFEKAEMDLALFLRCKREDLETLNIRDSQLQDKILQVAQKVKGSQCFCVCSLSHSNRRKS